MNRHYMLDTNTVSYILKGKSKASRERLAAVEVRDVVCISTITEGELRFGLAKLPDAGNRRAAVEWFLARLRVLPWGREEAQVYGSLRAKQEAMGKTLETMDMLIAAHAMAVGAILVTRDGAFSQVPGLGQENWATDL